MSASGAVTSTGSMPMDVPTKGEDWDNAGWDGRTLDITSTKVVNGATSTSRRRLHIEGEALVVYCGGDPVAPAMIRYVRAMGTMPELLNGKITPQGQFGAGACRPGLSIFPCMAAGHTPVPCLVTLEVRYFLKK